MAPYRTYESPEACRTPNLVVSRSTSMRTLKRFSKPDWSLKSISMETPERLSYLISRVASDERLKPSHISLYVALCHAWITSRFQRCYNVSRRQLMRLSRIQSKSTYHKAIFATGGHGMHQLSSFLPSGERQRDHPISESILISKDKIMNKRIYFITQAKGGAGKSVLAFMLAEKYKEAVILDLDDATTTSIKQLAYHIF